MQTPERSDFSNLEFNGTFENLQAMSEAETPHTQTRIIEKPGMSDYSITIKHGPCKQLVLEIHEDKTVEQLITKETQLIYSYERELKSTIATVNYGQTILYYIIKNTNPHLTCANVEGNDCNNNVDDINPQLMLYQCRDCKRFFSRLSEYREHLTDAVDHACNSCGKRFPNYGKYQLHCLGHGDPDRECRGCGKILANKYSLKKHMSICKQTLTRKLREFRKPPKKASN